VLRIGGGLDNGRRIKRGDLSPWSYVYTEQFSDAAPSDEETSQRAQLVLGIKPVDEPGPATGERARPALALPPPYPPRPPVPTTEEPCDPNRPRLFHIFWAGEFTDKPYMAILSFLYTQNLGLDRPPAEGPSARAGELPVCRPQFHVWINPGAASSVPDPSAKRKMYEGLATNPWAAPFLHPRFQEIVKFRLWNTTEQLDGVPELRDHWRERLHLKPASAVEDDDGGLTGAAAAVEEALSDEELLAEVIAQAAADGRRPKAAAAKEAAAAKGVAEKVSLGAKKEDYDKLSTVLSDMVRFVLLHRFGGVYLDADTLLLRDWEELWNWRGAWAYRWSKHDKYNTALIKLHKGSALTSFIFKTALENNLDFHPMHISRYLADAGLDPLLYRISDYVLDAAWINMEGFQRDRPPFPHFDE
jgi:WD repeat and SOF domain-containing protein 1